jgi:pantoate--beta-alanine ligase
MGALHAGHLSLARIARERADLVVVSIYVNPTQFDRRGDLETYPRDLDADLAALADHGVDVVLAPSDLEMYPDGFATRVTVDGLTAGLCGKSRPGHFAGVTTIVSKLFNLVRPHLAVFGEKDYQQLAVIRQMTRDLNFGVEIVGGPTVREPDGLAMSSRNLLLTDDQRRAARALSRALFEARDRFRRGEREAAALVGQARATIEVHPELRIDYLEIVDPFSLAELPADDSGRLPEQAHMALAVFAGDTRLIDNIRLSERDEHDPD